MAPSHGQPTIPGLSRASPSWHALPAPRPGASTGAGWNALSRTRQGLGMAVQGLTRAFCLVRLLLFPRDSVRISPLRSSPLRPAPARTGGTP